MGALRQWCIDTGQTPTEWMCAGKKVSRSALEGRTYSVPAAVGACTPEADVMIAIRDTLRVYGGYFCRTNTQGVVQSTGGGNAIMKQNPNKGFPDWVWLWRGTPWWIEAKGQDGALDTYQAGHLSACEKNGGVSVVVATLHGMDEAVQEWLILGGLVRRYPKFPFPIY